MKLFLDKSDGLNLVTGYADDHVKINQQEFRSNVVVTSRSIEDHWVPGGFATLCEADFQHLADLGAEIVLIGTGRRQRFPPPALLRPLMQARIGFEVMDLGSACRTFNILAHEGRSVAAALLLDGD